MNLLETILSAQNGDVVRQLAGKFGLDQTQAGSAIGALVPALGKGLSSNAQSSQGLQDLVGALGRGNHERYMDQPAALTDEAAVSDGNGILGHIFGSKEVSREVASRAATQSGVDSSVLKQMLPMLASAAMGAMAKKGLGSNAASHQDDAQASGLGSMLGGFLDSDNDGSILDDLAGMAGRFLR